jgi:protein SCO1/2
MLVRSAEQIEAALPDDLRADTQFVMVSFDTERDTPQNLLAYAQDKGLDKDNWHWLVGTPLQTRQLATLLGVQYRDAGNGVFAHSNLVTVVDPDGVPSARLEGITVDLEPAIDAILAAGNAIN